MMSDDSPQTRLVFTGPESTGKTFLSSLMAIEYEALLVEEYARKYLSNLNRNYDLLDLKQIEQGQQQAEMNALRSEAAFIFQDTDFLTIWIWYTHKYKINPDRVYNYLQRHLPDHYLLCFPDIRWFKDPLRENPTDREELFQIYEAEINKLKVPYTIIKGDYEERNNLAYSVINGIKLSLNN